MRLDVESNSWSTTAGLIRLGAGLLLTGATLVVQAHVPKVDCIAGQIGRRRGVGNFSLTNLQDTTFRPFSELLLYSDQKLPQRCRVLSGRWCTQPDLCLTDRPIA